MKPETSYKDAVGFRVRIVSTYSKKDLGIQPLGIESQIDSLRET